MVLAELCLCCAPRYNRRLRWIVWQDLIEAKVPDPYDESAKVRYEEYLRQTDPDSVELRLLQLERELAQAYTDPSMFDRLIDMYIAFRTAQSNWFWDRGERL